MQTSGAADIALADSSALIEDYSADLANLLANQAYAHQVGSFIQQSYETANTLDARCSVVVCAHGYAREALESIASHVLNCAQKLTDFLYLHDVALNDLDTRAHQVQDRIQLARKVHACSIVQSACRPKQPIGKCRIRVPDESLPSLTQIYERSRVDYSQFDGVGVAFNVTSDFASNASTPTTENALISHSIAPTLPSLSIPGPPPVTPSAPGPPPAITFSKRLSTSVGNKSIVSPSSHTSASFVSPIASTSSPAFTGSLPISIPPPTPPAPRSSPTSIGSLPIPIPPATPAPRSTTISPLASGSFALSAPPAPPPLPRTLSSGSSQIPIPPLPPPLPLAVSSPLSLGLLPSPSIPTPPPIPKAYFPVPPPLKPSLPTSVSFSAPSPITNRLITPSTMSPIPVPPPVLKPYETTRSRPAAPPPPPPPPPIPVLRSESIKNIVLPAASPNPRLPPAQPLRPPPPPWSSAPLGRPLVSRLSLPASLGVRVPALPFSFSYPTVPPPQPVPLAKFGAASANVPPPPPPPPFPPPQLP